MGMATETRKQVATRFQRVQQVQRSNRSPGTVAFFALSRYNQRRPASLLHHARSHNAHHPAVPALAVKYQRELAGQVRLSREPILNLAEDSGLFGLPLQIEQVQFSGDLTATLRVLASEELDYVAGHVHATGGVDARTDTKSDVSRCQPAPGFRQTGNLQQRFEAAVYRTAQSFQAQLGNGPVLSLQRHGISYGGDGRHFEKRVC